MKTRNVFVVLLMGVVLFSISYCEGAKKKKKDAEANEPTKLDRTVGDLAEVASQASIPVQGIGIVVGLNGTGSSECPPEIRDYLRKYILTQVGRKDVVNPDTMIDSLDTAVVSVEGQISPAASKYQSFDLNVKALTGTQTTSLAGGRLFTTELKLIAKVADSLESSRNLAYAAGPIYIDGLGDGKKNLTSGRVIGGGKVIDDYPVSLSLIKPDFRAAAYIRNRINQRFGKDAANALSESTINVSIPEQYRDKKERFIMLLKSLYIASAAPNEATQINRLIEELKTAKDKTKYQISIEAIGRPATDKLAALLEVNDPDVKFAAATTLVACGDQRGLILLREAAQNPASKNRLAAIKTVGDYGFKKDVVALMGRLISDDNFDVRYTAYTYLEKFSDPSVIRTVVAEDFFIDHVITGGPKTIYASRKQKMGITLFGAPIDCEKGIYIESDDGGIIINSEPTDDRISILRKHPVTGGLMGPLKCSPRMSDIIKLLCDPPAPKDEKRRPGLGVPYDELLKMLQKMSEKGAVKATFVAGPMN